MQPSIERIFLVPANTVLLGKITTRAIVRTDSGEELLKVLADHREKIVGVSYGGGVEDLPRRDDLKEITVGLVIKDKNNLIKNLHKLKGVHVLAKILPGEDFAGLAKFISTTEIPIDILDCIKDEYGQEVGELLEYYLHYTSLKAPFEPFHTILGTMLHSTKMTLFDMAMLNPDQFLAVDDEGNVAISLDALEKGEFLGALDDGPEVWEKSEPFLKWKEFAANLPQLSDECMECPFFFLCRGYSYYDSGKCNLWKKVFSVIHEAKSEIDQLNTEIEKQKKEKEESGKPGK